VANPLPNQWVIGNTSGATSDSGTLSNNGFFTLNFPDYPGLTGVPANNSILVFILVALTGLTSTSFAVTDDKGNTYTGLVGGVDTVNVSSCMAFRSMKVAGGVRKVRIQNLTGGVATFFQAMMVHCNDLNAFDTSAGNNGSASTSVTAGSLTPAQSGDFVIQLAGRTSVLSTTSWTPAVQSNITWQKLAGDTNSGVALQCGVYNSAAALNPQINMGTSSDFISVALAFSTGTFGSPPPAGMYVQAIHHIGQNAASALPITNPITVSVPLTGSLGVAAKISGPAPKGTINTLTDNNSNTWTIRAAANNDSSVQYAYAQNLVGGNALQLTVTINDATGSDVHFLVYDIVGASTNPFETEQQNTGNQAASGNLTSISGFTPTAPGLVICTTGVAFDTLNGVTGAGQVFDSMFFDGESASGPSLVDQNNGWCHISNSDLSAITFTWTKVGTLAIGNWASSAIAFASAPSGMGADFGNRPHPGRSPGRGGISSARFQTNWWPYAAAPSIVVALTGAKATFSSGTAGVLHTQALTGQSAAFTAGTIKAVLSKALTGLRSTFSAGALGVTHAQALTGQRATFARGIVSSALSVPLAGSKATFGAGTVIPVAGLFVALVGQRVSFSTGLLIPTATSSTASSATPGKLPPWPWTWTHDAKQQRPDSPEFIEALRRAILRENQLRADKKRLEEEFSAKKLAVAHKVIPEKEKALQNREYAILRRKIRATEEALSQAVTKEIELRLRALEHETASTDTVAARRQRELMIVLLIA
jgi:hypothetical protein